MTANAILAIPAAVALQAWTLVGIGTSVEVTTTAHALVEPAGVQQGDLLVACIASRIASTTSITLPASWTRVNESKTNNVVAGATTGIASAMMAFIERGASAPALTFTHPTAPSVAVGRIIAYRPMAPGSVVDVSAAGVTATAVTAVSIAGMTTTMTEELIVAMTAGGQAAAWSSFNATTPSGASGATDTTTNPSGTWRERVDTTTTTGADTSLGIFDAIKTLAGATGNFTVTASLGAGQALVAGAFKRIVSALDPHKKSADITLSGSNLTATRAASNPNTFAKVGGVNGASSGKYYFEVTLGTNIDGNFGLGIIGAAHDFLVTDTASWQGVDASGVGWYPGQNAVYHNNGTIGTLTGSSAVAGTVLCIAYDVGAKLWWGRLGAAGNWNDNASNNPGTGVGGFSMANINGIMVPCITIYTSTQACTINLGGTAFAGVVPTGFKAPGVP